MKWNISINDFLGGFAPAWYNAGTYPSYGNKNHAGAMTNVDLTTPGFLTQGPGLANLTNGTQAAAVTTLINSILDEAVASDVTYAIGGAKLYKTSSTAVTSDGTWPHTIDKAAVTAEDGEDVCAYQGNLYYSYNHSGSAGDIGKFDLVSTFDDDWGSTVPSGFAALQNAPHQMIVGGNDVMYIANGPYIASFDGTTLLPQALDLPTGTIVQSIAWNSDKLWIVANRPNLTGSNKNTASIYIWDGTTNSWEAEIRLMGTVGGCHVRNGVVFVFYQDITSTGGYKLAYISNGTVVDIANYTGSLPEYGQVTDYKDFLLWVSSGLIYAFGAGDKDVPVRLFQFTDGGYSTVGALACPFGTPMIASFNDVSSYRLAQFSGYEVNCTWKSLMFDVTGETGLSRLNTVILNFETLASGARVDWSLVNNKGTTIFSDNASYAKLGAATSQVTELAGKLTENFRIEFNFVNGSVSNPVKIKNVKIYGDSHQ